MPRRSATYTDTSFEPWMIISGIGCVDHRRRIVCCVCSTGNQYLATQKEPVTLGRSMGRSDAGMGNSLHRHRFTTSQFCHRCKIETNLLKQKWLTGLIQNRPNTRTSICRKILRSDCCLCLLSIAWMFGLVWWMWWLVIATTARHVLVASSVGHSGLKTNMSSQLNKFDKNTSNGWRRFEQAQPVDRDEEFSSVEFRLR